MKSRIFLKLLFVFVFLIAAVTVISDFLIRGAWDQSLRSQMYDAAVAQARMTALALEPNGHVITDPEYVRQLARAANARLTVIDSNGKVLADSDANAAEMENHATRPEFVAALHGNTGSNIRTSHTLGKPLLYVAVPARVGAVRVAYPVRVIAANSSMVRSLIWKASFFATVLAVLLAMIAAQAIARRLNRIVKFAESIARGNLSARIEEHSSDEIAQLAAALDATARQLETSFRSIETSRQQLEILLNSMQDPVIAISPEGRIQWTNGAAERLIGSAAKPGTLLVEFVRAPDLLDAVKETLQSQQATSRSVHFPGGRFFSLRCATLPNGGCVALLHDVSEIERIEQTRRDFIANVSHELRTPLTSIQGYTETLLDNEPEGPRREFLEILRANASRMARLTEDLLTLARVESGEQRFQFREVHAADLIAEVERNFKEMARSRQIALHTEPCETSVLGDPDALHQVFANLVENAIKYSPMGAKVVIGARRLNTEVEFYVRDSGIGIPSEHLGRIFERFYRVDKARSRDAGGTGLGLAIAKHIVIAHGGTLRAESTLNVGSTFIFSVRLFDSGRTDRPQGDLSIVQEHLA